MSSAERLPFNDLSLSHFFLHLGRKLVNKSYKKALGVALKSETPELSYV